MAKNKLISAIFWLVAAAGLSLSLAACNGGENPHSHTFAEGWTAGESTHWHAATCEHAGEKSGEAPHVDADSDGKCDVCDYAMPPAEGQPDDGHTHTFADAWSFDESTHWHAATCGHTDQKADEAPHVDVDENQFCDECGAFIEHVHKFSDTEWAFDESTHWRPAICTHKTEKGDENEHSFSGGVCECGVKASEVDVYNALTELEMTEDAFADWRAAIKADGVTDVKITSQNDILYMRDDETEVCYVAERTVKVKASIDGGEGLANVWFKVAMCENGTYHLNGNNSDALAVAETGTDGVAEITFKPIGGYSNGETVKYEILLAEAKDVAAINGTEEKDVKIIPNRYSLKLEEDEEVQNGKAVVTDFQVGETDETGTGDIAGTLEFKYDASWTASEKQMLPYVRYYSNPKVEQSPSDSPVEMYKTYSFAATAGNTFDFLLFSPAHRYDWSQGDTTPEFDMIQQNYRQSASGVYEISFATTNNVNARLYYWDGNLDLDTNKNADGSPKDSCVASVSGTKPEGSTVEDKKFTNGNYVSITISPDLGLESFQLGIICDDVCTVTITVKRTADYSNIVGDPVTVGSNTNNGEGYQFVAYKISRVPIGEIEPGLYEIKINSGGVSTLGAVQVFTKSEFERSFLWKNSSYIGFIRIDEDDEFINVRNGAGGFIAPYIEITEFETSTVSSGTTRGVPISRASNNDNIVSHFSQDLVAGNYKVQITIRSPYFVNTFLTVKIGSEIYNPTITGLEIYKFTLYADIAPNDTLEITGECRDISRFYCDMELTLRDYPEIKTGEAFEFDLVAEYQRDWMFVAEQAGTYKITVTLLESRLDESYSAVTGSDHYGDAACVQVYDNNSSRWLLKYTKFFEASQSDLQYTASSTFEAQAGEKFVLDIYDMSGSKSKFNIIFEFVE